MSEQLTFVNYYEVLEISQNASEGLIERAFRYFAQQFHPDNPETGDRQKFDGVMAAYEALRYVDLRAEYNKQLRNFINGRPVNQQASATANVGLDIEMQNKLLLTLYDRRRKSAQDPAVSFLYLQRTADCSAEHLEFYLWYMKEKGWIQRTPQGAFAITVEGIDHTNTDYQRRADKLITLQRT